jgi:excinuclease ABC subunit A
MSLNSFISIVGASENNLKKVNVDFKINQITGVAGPSGSGKTSLVFGTLYQESKRRFLNSLPSYVKFFGDRPSPVKVDKIFPVLPVFALPQNNPIVGSRHILADILEVTPHAITLFGLNSKEFCPQHSLLLSNKILTHEIIEEIRVNKIADDLTLNFFIGADDYRNYFLNDPLPSRSIAKDSLILRPFNQNDEFWEVTRVKLNKLETLEKKLTPYIGNKNLNIFYGFVKNNNQLAEIKKFNCEEIKICELCDYKGNKVIASQFNPLGALGACKKCKGYGSIFEVDKTKVVDFSKSIKEGGLTLLRLNRFKGLEEEFLKEAIKKNINLNLKIFEQNEDFWNLFIHGNKKFSGLNKIVNYLERKKYKANERIFLKSIQKEVSCDDCQGSRSSQSVLNFGLSLKDNKILFYKDINKLSVFEFHSLICDIEVSQLINNQSLIAFKKIKSNLETAMDLGMGHLSLDRKVKTLSSGEYQRALMVKHLSYEGTGSLFVFDEPSLGLSNEEIQLFFEKLRKLIQQKNTVIVIEHSDLGLSLCDEVIYVGPGSGSYGGEIVKRQNHPKAEYIKSFHKIQSSNSDDISFFQVLKPSLYGKIFNSFRIQKNSINVAIGRSGTGKSSSLINVLANFLSLKIKNETLIHPMGSFEDIVGNHSFDDVLVINAHNTKSNSRSQVGTITELFTPFRKHYLSLTLSKTMSLQDGHFSTNSELGKCSNCDGKGYLVVEMQFLEDVILDCDDCLGIGLKLKYSKIHDGKYSIGEALKVPLDRLFENIRLTPKFQRIIEYTKLLNLEYLSLSRQSSSLSGGERQRLTLLSHLLKNPKESLIIIENISFGLSTRELVGISDFIERICREGNNTVVIIDQHEYFQSKDFHLINFNS